MKESYTMIISILAVLLSIVAIVSSFGVKPADIEANSIGQNEIIDGSVTTNEISDNTIMLEDLNSAATNYIIEMFNVPENGVQSENIVDKSITNDDGISSPGLYCRCCANSTENP